MQFSVVFWNIWLKNQLRGEAHATRLLNELTQIVETYQPDCIGLNEVLQHVQASSPFVLDHLKRLGYTHSHFALASSFTDEWLIGAGFASRHRAVTQSIVLSEDVPAERRGYKGHTLKAIVAQVTLPEGKKVDVVVAHPLALRPDTYKAHRQATHVLADLLRQDELAHTAVLGGDFNESVHWPHSFHRATADLLNYKTGTLMRPTWQHNAWAFTPLRINLDHVYWPQNNSIILKHFEVIDSKVSDHRPLYARFELAKS
jgi:endonuclease/exonuclease/phosphatase family metal-dependent hydrolase